MTWAWPLIDGTPVWPDELGSFGAVRRHDVHTGIDLYTEPGNMVVACEQGLVVRIEDYTGPKAGSPWWNDTQAILVEGPSGVLCYGEVAPLVWGLAEGARVKAAGCVGRVQTVLKSGKGRPDTMLHLELYRRGTRESVVWGLDEERPPSLKDPTELLRAAWGRLSGPKRVYQAPSKEDGEQRTVESPLGHAFEEALKAVFKDRAEEFSKGLREMLREFYEHGCQDGRREGQHAYAEASHRAMRAVGAARAMCMAPDDETRGHAERALREMLEEEEEERSYNYNINTVSEKESK